MRAVPRTHEEFIESFQYGKHHRVEHITSDGALAVSRMYFDKKKRKFVIQPKKKLVRLKMPPEYTVKTGDILFEDVDGMLSIMSPSYRQVPATDAIVNELQGAAANATQS